MRQDTDDEREHGQGAPVSAGLEEPDLRRLFQSAVDGIEPSEAALERLRVAVPARRARKRQAVVGVAAAALLFGTGIPAAVHVAGAPDGPEEHPAMAGSSQATRQDTSSGSPGSGRGHHDGPGARESDAGRPGKDGSGTHRAGSPHSAPSDVPRPTGSAALAAAPTCAGAQLGEATATTGAPTSDGTIYGTFRVVNVSDKGCAVKSPGTVHVDTLGAAARSSIPVVEHHSGDAAPALPAPSEAVAAMLLAPGASYEVRFAWVPAENCASDPGTAPSDPGGEGDGGGGGDDGGTGGGGTENPPVDPTPSAGAGGGGGGDASPAGDNGASETRGGTDASTGTGTGTGKANTANTAVSTQFVAAGLVREDGGGGEGSISLTHSTLPGGPTAGTTLPDACGGTVYRTELLPAG